ncbi:DUF2909 family protein [Chitinibacter sp. SCUT-21]|uniref:DUF2909 family protein n=1 Tax=Chitinibacter sp. SCUT-21 TaxID=2970891 RepID=UPI0035A6FAC9
MNIVATLLLLLSGILLLALLFSLAQALLSLIRGASQPMWKMLAWRVGLSITLFIVLLCTRWQS